MEPRTVLGIDPGLAVAGYGAILFDGRTTALHSAGALRGHRGDRLSEKLRKLHDETRRLLAGTRPSAVVLEQAFYGRNIQSTLRLGEARGVILAAAAAESIPVFEYPTASVKKALTGNGAATKEQVRYMVGQALRLAAPPGPLDVTDALALALAFCLDPTREGPLAEPSLQNFLRS